MIQTKVTPIRVYKEYIEVLDQRKLPLEEKWERLYDEKGVFQAIKEMWVRGAPLIGIVASWGFYLGVKKEKEVSKEVFSRIFSYLSSSRPTAYNLFYALKRMKEKGEEALKKGLWKEEIEELLWREAYSIWEEDKRLCYEIARNMYRYLVSHYPQKKKWRILTHCNTGALATGGIGTALGAIRYLFSQGMLSQVYTTETRPFYQGLRLNVYELEKDKIPYTLVVDSAVGFLFQKGEVDAVFVGADRITRRGDVANKIGTYTIASLSYLHKIPFFVLAPFSTWDLSLEKGEEIPIEKRSSEEILFCKEEPLSFSYAKVENYAFDITPREYIQAIINEKGEY